MKKHSLLFIIFICIFLYASYSKQKSEWKGKIKLEDGVTVVYNPQDPIYRSNIFYIEKELSIERKSTKPKEEMFQNIVSLVIDEAGNFYILDKKASNIKLFNKDGKFLKIIGRKGEGPGEFIAPEKGSLRSNNELYIYDSRRYIVQVIDTEGKFIKQIPVQTPWFDGPKFLSDGELIASFGEVGTNIKFNLNKFNTNMEPILTYASIPVLKPPKVNIFVYIFNADLKWDVGPESEIIWGAITTPEYELFVHDKDGNYIKKITKEYSPVKLTNEEYKKLMKKWFGKVPSGKQFDFVIPKNYPPFQGFIVDGKGQIFVHRFVEVDKSNNHYFDVFDAEGKFIAIITLNEKTVFGTFKNNKLYTIEEEKDGFQIVKRYKVTWNY